jgi:hypothetical protein
VKLLLRGTPQWTCGYAARRAGKIEACVHRPRPLRALRNDAVIAGDGSHPPNELELSPPGASIVVLTSHATCVPKEWAPAVADSHGHLERSVEQGTPALTWGVSTGRNSALSSPLT